MKVNSKFAKIARERAERLSKIASDVEVRVFKTPNGYRLWTEADSVAHVLDEKGGIIAIRVPTSYSARGLTKENGYGGIAYFIGVYKKSLVDEINAYNQTNKEKREIDNATQKKQRAKIEEEIEYLERHIPYLQNRIATDTKIKVNVYKSELRKSQKRLEEYKQKLIDIS